MSRLKTILDAIPSDARSIADIGYDHGHLMAELVRRRPGATIVGSELQPTSGALFAQLHPRQAREVTLVVGSGLKPLAGLEVLDPQRGTPLDTVVIAGMGEHLIATLVREAPAAILRGVRQLVLCPADFRHALRPELAELGWRSEADWVASERGRHYEVLRCVPMAPPSAGSSGAPEDWTTSDEAYFGTLSGEVLHRYCASLVERHRAALKAPAEADTPVLRKLRRAQAIVASALDDHA